MIRPMNPPITRARPAANWKAFSSGFEYIRVSGADRRDQVPEGHERQ